MNNKNKKVMCVASAGGHFNQLMMLRAGWAGAQAHYVTTLAGMADPFGATPVHLVPDCNANTPFRLLASAGAIAWLMLRIRPDAVITTGALPGVLALFWGRLFGARTLWIDSIANAETLSASGRLARRIAHETLSQWPEVAAREGVEYRGAVL